MFWWSTLTNARHKLQSTVSIKFYKNNDKCIIEDLSFENLRIGVALIKGVIKSLDKVCFAKVVENSNFKSFYIHIK